MCLRNSMHCDNDMAYVSLSTRYNVFERYGRQMDVKTSLWCLFPYWDQRVKECVRVLKENMILKPTNTSIGYIGTCSIKPSVTLTCESHQEWSINGTCRVCVATWIDTCSGSCWRQKTILLFSCTHKKLFASEQKFPKG